MKKEWFTKGILPIAGMVAVLIITHEIYMVEGKVDFIRLWMCVGIPFGIAVVRTFWVPLSIDLVTLLGGLLLYFVICGFLGGLVAIFSMVRAVIVLIKSLVFHFSRPRISCKEGSYEIG